MIEEGFAFSAAIPYPIDGNKERRRFIRRRLRLQLSEFGAEHIQTSPPESDEILSQHEGVSEFEIRGFSPSSTNAIDDIREILKKAGSQQISLVRSSRQRRSV